jgi:hypothetical protein
LKILIGTIPAILMQAYDVRQSRRAISHASGTEKQRKDPAGQSSSADKAAAKGDLPSGAGSGLVTSPRVGL